MKRVTFVLLSLFLLAGCGMADGEYISGSGNVVAEERPVDGAFTEIVLANNGDVTVVQGPERAIVVEAEDNLLPYLTTEISNGTLTLATERGMLLQEREPIRYTVTLPEVERLEIAGSGDISSEQIVGEDLTLEVGGSGALLLESLTARRLETTINGSGSIALGGDVQEQEIALNGSGDYDAAELVSENATVTIAGSGTVTVWAAGALDASINGSGDLIYYGNPQVEQTVNGSGDLIAGGGR